MSLNNEAVSSDIEAVSDDIERMPEDIEALSCDIGVLPDKCPASTDVLRINVVRW
jgi:hypothetical protein